MKKMLIILFLCGLVFCTFGCQEPIRLAPSEAQKQTAELTHSLAQKIYAEGTEPASPATHQLVKGTQASLAYTGRPKVPPDPQQFETVVSQATIDAQQRPDPWKAADSALELGIGICALLGGVYGTRAVKFLQLARDKTKALEEVVKGNELLKKNGGDFKAAHAKQSPKTKAIVAEIKAEA